MKKRKPQPHHNTKTLDCKAAADLAAYAQMERDGVLPPPNKLTRQAAGYFRRMKMRKA